MQGYAGRAIQDYKDYTELYRVMQGYTGLCSAIYYKVCQFRHAFFVGTKRLAAVETAKIVCKS